MTIAKAIARFDVLYPNCIPYAQKLEFLSELDGTLFSTFFSKYEENKNKSFTGYYLDTDKDTELLIEYPFDHVYYKYLAAQCDDLNSDTAGYENSSIRFNASIEDFMNHYNRHHKIIPTKITEMR